MERAPGGKGSLTPQDLAAALHALSEIETELLWVKYAGHPRSKLWALWFERLMSKGWSDGTGKVEQISIITLDECVSPSVCNACNGVGEVTVGSKVLVCHVCDGARLHRLSQRAIARRLGFATKIHEPWRTRVAIARKLLSDIEVHALGLISRGLRTDPR